MTLPPELIDNIFELLEPLDDPVRSARRKIYRRLLTVCQSWHASAERALYRSIALSDRKSTHMLVTTLRNRDSLGKFVLDLGLYEKPWDPMTGLNVELVSLCPNLQSIDVVGQQKDHFTALKNAIMSLKSLRSLKVSMFSLSPGRAFCDMPELLSIMTQLPALDTVIITSNVPNQRRAPVPYPTERGCCPLLRRFECNGSFPLTAFDLRGILSISASAPLTYFQGRVTKHDEGSIVALGECLTAWAGSLTNLNILLDPDFTELTPEIDEIFASERLHSLRYLTTSASLVSPTTLLKLSSLRALYYAVTKKEEHESLVAGLRSRASGLGTGSLLLPLPTLQELVILPLAVHLRNTGAIPSASQDSLQQICSERGIICTDLTSPQHRNRLLF